MTRTVLDTNAIVSALLFNDSPPGRALIRGLGYRRDFSFRNAGAGVAGRAQPTSV